jgi:hypothetical protein
MALDPRSYRIPDHEGGGVTVVVSQKPITAMRGEICRVKGDLARRIGE